MIPANLPRWGKKAPTQELGVPLGRNISLGARGEASLVDEGTPHIVIEIRAAGGAHSGSYRAKYLEGQPLGTYLRALRLKSVACHNAIYDLKAKNSGRLRLSYTPTKGSHIVIGSFVYGASALHQRSSIDAQKVAARMGGTK